MLSVWLEILSLYASMGWLLGLGDPTRTVVPEITVPARHMSTAIAAAVVGQAAVPV
jgi:hypothetical protein